MSDTLLLDPSGTPVDILSWQDAVTLYYKNRVIILESDEDRILHSPSFELQMPLVIQLKNSFARRMRREVPFSRRNIAIRDRSTCQYCGKLLKTQDYTYDHIIPSSRGGLSQWKNLVLCCVKCNFKKANRTPEEAGMSLLYKPEKPSIKDARFTFRLRITKIHPKWADYAYWNCTLDER